MLVAFALGPVWAFGPMAPPTASAADTLPACRYDDVETVFTSPADWQRTLVDTIYMIGKSYIPPDLVPVTDAGINGNGEIRSFVIPDLRDMAEAAKAAGTPIAVQSAYRSYATQIYTFSYWTQEYGSDAALLGSARPGHSEHQLGVAMDFRSAGTSAEWVSDWATTAAGAWMAGNAWRYGFVMSYPKGVSPKTTCYRYEPWHYRYVGRDEAAAIHVAGITLREYLWYRAGNDGLGRGDDHANRCARRRDAAGHPHGRALRERRRHRSDIHADPDPGERRAGGHGRACLAGQWIADGPPAQSTGDHAGDRGGARDPRRGRSGRPLPAPRPARAQAGVGAPIVASGRAAGSSR